MVINSTLNYKKVKRPFHSAMNYNNLVTEVDLETAIFHSLDCKDSKYCHQPDTNKVTWDLKVLLIQEFGLNDVNSNFCR